MLRGQPYTLIKLRLTNKARRSRGQAPRPIDWSRLSSILDKTYAINMYWCSRKNKLDIPSPAIDSGSLYQQILAHIGLRPQVVDEYPACFLMCSTTAAVDQRTPVAIRGVRAPRLNAKTPDVGPARKMESLRFALKFVDTNAFLCTAASARGLNVWASAVAYFRVRKAMRVRVVALKGVDVASRHLLLGTSYQVWHCAFTPWNVTVGHRTFGDACVVIAMSLANVTCDVEKVRHEIRCSNAGSPADKRAFVAAELGVFRAVALKGVIVPGSDCFGG